MRLSDMGRRVSVMIGGMTDGADEGYAFAQGEAPGAVTVTGPATFLPAACADCA